MDTRIIFLACLCVVAKSNAKLIGENCANDAECTTTATAVANSKCDTGGTDKCICDTDYVKTDDNTMCKAKADAACTGAGAGNCIANAACSTTCSCNAGYKAAANKETCDAIYDMTCTDDAGCTGLANSKCSGDAGNMQCKCADGYKHVAPACTQVIGGSCTADADCSSVVTNSECTGAANSMTCNCMNGYKANAGSTACGKVYDMTCTVDADCIMLKYGKCTGTPMKCKCNTATAVMESDICKLKAGGDCNTGGTTDDICPLNSACSGSKCTCSGDYEADTTTNLCKAKNGSGMTVASVMLIVTALATVLLR